ncbi:MAG: hemerythrin domain-containing protein [Ignavibacteriae bacterium]|nr:hemerythrin domain-containing protein [Ignavibacteriota bacterium]
MRKTTDPIAQLMQEHNNALVQLKLLNRAVYSFSQDGYSSKYFKQIKAALKFIEEEVSVHNHKEEAALFPVLERYIEGPTRLMRSDHKKLRKGFTRLSTAINTVQSNRDSFSAIKRLRIVAKDVVQLFVNHIHKENYILFPLVQKFLSKEELREIAKKML